MNFRCDNVIEARGVVNKGEIKCIIVDIAVLSGSRTGSKEKSESGGMSRFEKENEEDLEHEKCNSRTCDCGSTRKYNEERWANG